jgi:stage IV sporulation protein FB
LFRLVGDSKLNHVEKKIEMTGISLDRAYEELPDEDYWKMRNILVEEHPGYKDIAPAPPYEYSPKEERVMTTIQSLLQRHLIQDVSIIGKILIFLVWAAAFASPWLLNMDMSFLGRFGF